jgi:hypothetical protein
MLGMTCLQRQWELDPSDVEKLEIAVNNTLEWLNCNQLAEVS